MIDGSTDDVGKAPPGPRDSKITSGRAPAAVNKNTNVSALRDRVRKMQQGMRSSDDIAQGIEALEAVAALATSSRSSGKGSPQRKGSSSPGTDDTSVSPSKPAAAHLRSTGRGMAALNKVGAGSRRVWESASSVGGSKDRAGSKASRNLLRVSSGFSRQQNDLERRYYSGSDASRRPGSNAPSLPVDGQRTDADLPFDNSGARPGTEISSSSSTSVSPEVTLPARLMTRSVKSGATISGGEKKTTQETKRIASKNKHNTAHGRGFSPMKLHESFTPPAGVASNGTGGLGERGSVHGRLKARGWWAQAHDKDASDGSKATLVGIKAENAELRLESRRLEDALNVAQVTQGMPHHVFLGLVC